MNAWQRLAQVSAFRFVARSEKASGWHGRGHGTVTVCQPDARTIIFTETGCWQPDNQRDARQLVVHNVYRWSRHHSDAAIRLEHLRFGLDNPVYLLELQPQTEQIWYSVLPHVCGDDVYSAQILLMADQLELHWAIKGPNKDEALRYRYT